MAVDRAPDIRPHARTILLANAGQRDIRLDGKYIGQRSTDPLPDGGSGVPTIRSESREILNAFDDWVGMLSAPIIQQAIESLSPQTIDQVVVYGTDQPVSVAEKHRGGDTLHMAELVARILQHAEAASSVRCRAVGKPNVHLADVMYRFFRNEFRSADPHLSSVRRDYDTPARVIVSLAGGTPGANLGLLLAAIEAFGDRVEAIQPSEDGSARRLDISAIIRRQALTQPARQLLGLGQFDAAAQVIRAWILTRRWPPWPTHCSDGSSSTTTRRWRLQRRRIHVRCLLTCNASLNACAPRSPRRCRHVPRRIAPRAHSKSTTVHHTNQTPRVAASTTCTGRRTCALAKGVSWTSSPEPHA